MNPDCQGSDAVATGQEALAVVQAWAFNGLLGLLVLGVQGLGFKVGSSERRRVLPVLSGSRPRLVHQKEPLTTPPAPCALGFCEKNRIKHGNVASASLPPNWLQIELLLHLLDNAQLCQLQKASLALM